MTSATRSGAFGLGIALAVVGTLARTQGQITPDARDAYLATVRSDAAAIAADPSNPIALDFGGRSVCTALRHGVTPARAQQAMVSGGLSVQGAVAIIGAARTRRCP